MRPLFLLPLVLLAGAAQAQSDREVAERAIAASADLCPGHSAERTGPTVRAVPVGALRVLAQHGAVLCPDRRLDAAVAFYPRYGVFTWNPESEASSRALVRAVDALTRSEEFPAEISVWDTDARPLREQVVPAFEPRPNAALNRWLAR